MKAYLIVAVLLALTYSAKGQQGEDLEQAVRTSIFTGVSEGQRVKEIQRAGDAAAVMITKVVADRQLTDAEREIALDLLQQAFSRLSWVTAPADREPRAALFVADAISCSSGNSGLITKSGDVKRAIVNSVRSFETGNK